ncbi:MAG: ribosome small subunit-dependent GTPase A [Tissierellia bacterium]|nr:ribosome small subunit-dependent GTPase A [Tissierellia bacterium]
MKGRIIKSSGGFYYIKSGDKRIETRARGVFRHENIEPIVGDIVDFKYGEDTLGYIEEIYPRKNMLVRPKVANVDLALIMIPLKDPKYNLNLIDKMIVQCEKSQIDILICINKIDLDRDHGVEIGKIYEQAGFDTIKISVKEGENLQKLETKLKSKTTALCGVSGAGKSSLTNILMGKKLEVGEVSQKTKRGKHTTRHVELYSKDDYYIFDTPGFSSLQLNLPKEELSHYFREFKDYRQDCKFHNCNHINEPKCGVKRAVKLGNISSIRYENYQYLFQELEQRGGY